MGWIVLLVMFLFLFSGAALAYVFGATAVLSFLATDNSRYLAVLPQRIFAQLDVFAYMSMPLFILAGEIMNRAGITKVLINLAMSIIGRFKGSLGYVNIMTSVFFAGISGTASADTVALSNTLVPAMKKEGYDGIYAGAITAASSIIGPIIPPSVILIIYGALMKISVGTLFVAGILPGLLLAIGLCILNGYFAHRDDHPGGNSEGLPLFWPSFVKALPALSLPVIILGGIVFGVMTPTEAAGVAVIVATAIGLFNGSIDTKKIWASFKSTSILTGSLFILLCTVACISYLAGLLQWTDVLAAWINASGLTGYKFIILLNFVFLVAGMVMEVPVAVTLLVPLLAPAAIAQGFNPIHLGIMLCFNLCIGLITPPIGGCLIMVATVTREKYWSLVRAVMPFVLVEIFILAILIAFPDITLILPRLAGFNVGG